MASIVPVVSRHPNTLQLAALTTMAVVYGGATLALIRWAHQPLALIPRFNAVYVASTALASLCAAALLAVQSRRAQSEALLVLTCAFLFSGVMELAYLLAPATEAFVVFGRLGATGLILLAFLHALRRRASLDVVFAWLGWVLVAWMTALLLSAMSGGPGTLGWYAARCSFAISACVLPVFLLTRVSGKDRASSSISTVATYVMALAIVCTAIIIRGGLAPWLGNELPYATLFSAVALTAWIGGWKPALVAAFLGYLTASSVFIWPADHVELDTPAGKVAFVLYVVGCVLIIGLDELLRRARDRYQKAEALFRDSQEASVQGFTLFRPFYDPGGRVIDFRFEYINPMGAAMANIPAEDLIGKMLRETLPAVVSSGVFATLARVAETGEPSDLEVRYESDRVSGWFRNIVVKAANDLIAVSYLDITRSKELEAELKLHAADLERADANKRQFLAMLSHELRNPLAPIRNGLALLTRRTENEEVASIYGMMERQLAQLTRLIDDLLDVSRIDRGKLDLRMETVSVDALVRCAAEIARPNIDPRLQELRVTSSVEPLFVQVDPARLTQVISNVLNNASKFTPPKGRIEVSVLAENGQAVVEVRDNGIGIPKERLQQIFDPFIQLEPSRRHTPSGLGLGLTLARSIVALHGGSVEARSGGTNLGSTFIVRIPLVTPAVSDPLPALQREGAVHQRILVVDDNIDTAMSLARLLRGEGHEVQAACDGLTALRLGAQLRPQLAFIDLNMPGMDGIELASRIRAEPWGAAVCLVALTGMAQKSDIERTRAAGFHGHLTKPAQPEELSAVAATRCEGGMVQFTRPQTTVLH